MNPRLLPNPSQRSGTIVLTNDPASSSAEATPADPSAIMPCVLVSRGRGGRDGVFEHFYGVHGDCDCG